MNPTPQETLIKLYDRLNGHDAEGMAECYQPDARFRDIAFNLQNREQIYAMWAFICRPGTPVPGSDARQAESEIGAKVMEQKFDGAFGVSLVETDYYFGDERRPVHNVIRSKLMFKDGLIYRQQDDCNSLKWGLQAIGGFKGVIAGLVPFVRRKAAMDKVKNYMPQAFSNV